MKKVVYRLGLTILCLSAPTLTFADVQMFTSQAGQAVTTYVGNQSIGGNGNPTSWDPPNPISGPTSNSVPITPDSLWAFPTNGGPNGAQWISNSASGFGDTDFQNFNTTHQIFDLSINV